MEDKIIYLDEVISTNIYAAEKIKNGENIKCVIADFQTSGSGRMGRIFHSPRGVGIYMTYVLNTENIKTLNLITSAAGLAAAEAIEEIYGIETKIKWPNDILLSGKKACGILTKLITENGKIKFALIGIGVNVSNEKNDFPEELKQIATSLKIETGKEIDKNILTQKIIENLDKIFIEKIFSERKIVDEIKKRSSMLQKKVFVKNEGKEYFALDISPDGGLVVKDGEGEKVIHSGEVELY